MSRDTGGSVWPACILPYVGYAPVARIVTATDPGGSAFSIDSGRGDGFPAPPFKALVWPSQQRPILGVNAEEPTVLTITDDTFTLLRGVPAIDIEVGLQIAALGSMGSYSPGDVISLAAAVEGGSPPYTLLLRDPGGTSFTEGGHASASWAGTAGAADLARSGIYHFAFADVHGKRSTEQDFFVQFSEV